MGLELVPGVEAVNFDSDLVILFFTAFFVVWVGGFLAGYVVSWFRRLLNDSIL